MLWIAGDTRFTWSQVVEALCTTGSVDLVVLLYPRHPGSDMPAPFLACDTPEGFESVTQWDDDNPATESQRLPATPEAFSAISMLATGAFEAPWDIIAVRPGERSWLAASVPHEEMVMVSDDSMLSLLREHGVIADSKPPD